MTAELPNSNDLKPVRKKLRKKPPSAESRLWDFLKDSQLEGRKFRRQHSIRNFIYDFYCATEKLIIELDGLSDELKNSNATSHGYKILKIENKLVFDNISAVLLQIKSQFKLDQASSD